MKKVGDLMKEAGFSPKASTSVKEAYIKSLIKAATGVNVSTPSEKKEMAANPKSVRPLPKKLFPKEAALPQQLSFDFEADNEPAQKSKKAL